MSRLMCRSCLSDMNANKDLYQCEKCTENYLQALIRTVEDHCHTTCAEQTLQDGIYFAWYSDSKSSQIENCPICSILKEIEGS